MRLQYPNGDDIIEGDYVYDTQRDDSFLVGDIDVKHSEVALLTHRGYTVYASPEQLELIDRE